MQQTAYPYYGNAPAPCGVTVILTGNTEFVNFPWKINRKTPGILSLRVLFHKQGTFLRQRHRLFWSHGIWDIWNHTELQLKSLKKILIA